MVLVKNVTLNFHYKMEEIKYAYVLFTNGTEKIVPISMISGCFPQSRLDFNNNKRWKVWWHGTKSKNDYLLNANILMLGSKYLTVYIVTKEF